MSFTCNFCKVNLSGELSLTESWELKNNGSQHNCEEIKNNIHGFIRKIIVDPCKFEYANLHIT